jgi:hypothetical protein
MDSIEEIINNVKEINENTKALQECVRRADVENLELVLQKECQKMVALQNAYDLGHTRCFERILSKEATLAYGVTIADAKSNYDVHTPSMNYLIGETIAKLKSRCCSCGKTSGKYLSQEEKKEREKKGMD